MALKAIGPNGLEVTDHRVKIGGVTYVWPAANAAGILMNDGAGNLAWNNNPTLTGLATTGNVGIAAPPSSSYTLYLGGTMYVASTLGVAGDLTHFTSTVLLNQTSGNTNVGYSADQGYRLAVNGTLYVAGDITTPSAIHLGTVPIIKQDPAYANFAGLYGSSAQGGLVVRAGSGGAYGILYGDTVGFGLLHGGANWMMRGNGSTAGGSNTSIDFLASNVVVANMATGGNFTAYSPSYNHGFDFSVGQGGLRFFGANGHDLYDYTAVDGGSYGSIRRTLCTLDGSGNRLDTLHLKGGQVGIGQSTPAYVLDVTGRIHATTGYQGILTADVPTISATLVDFDGVGTNIANGVAYASGWVSLSHTETFTSSDPSYTYEIVVRGNALFLAAGAAQIGSQVIISGTGGVTRQIGGDYVRDASDGGNFLAGSGPVVVNGLANGSHTVTVQVWASTAGTIYVRGGTDFMSILVREYRR